MSQKSRHNGDVEIVALGAGTNDASADGTITLRYNVIIPGDLTVQGETTSVETTNTEIKDRIVTLNKGETGAGVTLNTAGLEIDRGSLDNAFIQWNETNGTVELVYASGSGITLDMNAVRIINVQDPASAQDAATKNYVDTEISSFSTNSIYEDDSSVTVSDPGAPGAVDVTIDSTHTAQFNISGITLYNGATEISTTSGDDLTVSPDSGVLVVDASQTFKYQSSTPSVDASGVIVYANSTSTDTQLNYKNSTGSGELVSRRRAILYGLIF